MDGGFKGKKNVYICGDCGHGFVTQDSNEGTTPFQTTCLNCGCMASSMFYNIPQELLGNPAVRWIKPLRATWGKFNPAIRHHLEMGGLIRNDTKGLPSTKPRKKAFRQ